MLKKLVRFLSDTEHTCYKMQLRRAEADGVLRCVSDASWASGPGCRSTSGGFMFVQGFPLLHYSRTQPTVIQSSCESELVGISMLTGEGLVAQKNLQHLDMLVTVDHSL